MVSTLDGISISISPCFGLSPSTWTTTGHVGVPKLLMYVLLKQFLERLHVHSTVQKTGSSLSEKERMMVSHPGSVYNFAHYVAYALYPPLYIAGPIMTFNDFMWQVCSSSIDFLRTEIKYFFHLQILRPLSLSHRDIFAYALRFTVCLLTMEFILHFMYMVAIKDTRAWAGDSAAQLSMIGFWNLIIVWLKVSLFLRYFWLRGVSSFDKRSMNHD